MRRAERMERRAEEFQGLVGAVLGRFFAQNGQPLPVDADIAALVARLRELIAERGLPPALTPEERGAPGEIAESEIASLVARVLGGEERAKGGLLAEAAKQLVKACFYPEFKTCRDSFREVTADGSCRRQELARVQRRISGSHCVDCPYWQTLDSAQHEKFLAREWQAGPGDFAAHREVFLPEDFRALRQWVRARAPRPGTA